MRARKCLRNTLFPLGLRIFHQTKTKGEKIQWPVNFIRLQTPPGGCKNYVHWMADGESTANSVVVYLNWNWTRGPKGITCTTNESKKLWHKTVILYKQKWCFVRKVFQKIKFSKMVKWFLPNFIIIISSSFQD